MASLLEYLVKRTARFLISLFIIITGIFLLFRLAPGDPTGILVASHFTEEAQEQMLSRFGLNRPVHEQYIIYISNILQGDFGLSFVHREPVLDIILPRLMRTLVLTIPALILILLVAYFFGTYLGWTRGQKREEIGSFVIITFRSLPHFVLGIFLLILFSYWLNIFPTGGLQDPFGEQLPLRELIFTFEFYHHYFLPFVTIFVYFLTFPTLLMRGNVIAQRQEDYVSLHRVKGLSERKIRNNVARNSVLPLITYSSSLVGIAFGGVILIEIVYNWPGIGWTIVNAVVDNDYPLAQGAFYLIAFVVLFANLVIDVIYMFVDPRIRYGGGE